MFRILTSFGVIICFFVSCKKSVNTITTSNDVLNIIDFPLKINDQWRYQVHDFYANTIDTLILKITGSKSDSNEKDWFVTIIIDSTVVDSAIIKQTGNQIFYSGLNPSYSYFGNYILDFPISLYSSWQGLYPPDTTTVVSIDSNIHVLNNAYVYSLFLKRAFALINGDNLTQTLIICPKIGIIQQTIDFYPYSGVPQKQNFSLIDYKIY